MTTAWTGEPHRERPAYKVKFGNVQIVNDDEPLNVRVVEDRPRYSRDTRYIGEKHAPVRLSHRTGIVLGLISLLMIAVMVVTVLLVVTPTLHSP